MQFNSCVPYTVDGIQGRMSRGGKDKRGGKHSLNLSTFALFWLQADRGCAAVEFFFGGRGWLGIKGCNAPRATDFREETNPPQADSEVYCKRIILVPYNISILP